MTDIDRGKMMIAGQHDLGNWIKTPFVKGTTNDLRKASFDELLRKFQRCHDEIWEGGKTDPATAFDEFSKLLMAKVYDERFTPFNGEYHFQIVKGEEPGHVAKKIRDSYEQVKEKNSDVFKVEIKLSDNVIFEVVRILQDTALRSTDLDIKGRAFERFLGKVFRDEYGQYFTPRNIVRFMVEVLDPDENDLIIDPACGSGGFLLYSLMHVTDKISQRYKDDRDSLARISWDFAHKQLFGIEINDRIARISMMDMVIHEDGHSNIECNNALSDYEAFDKKRDIKPNKYTILFTNPPFGAFIRDKDILSRFELAKGKINQKTEILFIERCLNLVRPGGRIAIVLPDSILTNSSLTYVRDYILRNARILSMVSLPQHAFVPSGAGVKSSLLFLEKNNGRSCEERKCLMAIAKHIGFDSRGKEDSDDLIDILDDWRAYLSGKAEFKRSFVVSRQELGNSFSPEQFVFYSNHQNWETKTLSELCGGVIFTGKSPPRNSYVTEGYKLLKVRDLTGKGIDWDNEVRAFVSHDFFLKNQRVRLQENDVLFIAAAHHPKYIGEKIDIVDRIPDRFKQGVICSAQLMVLRVNPEHIDPYYVLLFLKTTDGYKAIQSCIRGQTAHIYPKDIGKLKITIPPANEMSRIKIETEKMKEYLMKKGEADEKYVDSLKSAMTFMESD